jgi:hypothetical protein
MFGARYCVYSLLLGRVQGSMVQIQGLQMTGLTKHTLTLASAAHGPGCNANVYNLNRFARDKVQNDH